MWVIMDNLITSSQPAHLICKNGSVHQSLMSCPGDCGALQTPSEKQTHFNSQILDYVQEIPGNPWTDSRAPGKVKYMQYL